MAWGIKTLVPPYVYDVFGDPLKGMSLRLGTPQIKS